jgi:hypothetical protein
MPTHIPVRRDYRGRPSIATVCIHALLAAAIIAAIAATVIWVYT